MSNVVVSNVVVSNVVVSNVVVSNVVVSIIWIKIIYICKGSAVASPYSTLIIWLFPAGNART